MSGEGVWVCGCEGGDGMQRESGSEYAVLLSQLVYINALEI